MAKVETTLVGTMGVHGLVQFGLKLKPHRTAKCKKKSHPKSHRTAHLYQTESKPNQTECHRDESFYFLFIYLIIYIYKLFK